MRYRKYNGSNGPKTNYFLLKLHGSINWYPIRGYNSPYSVDAIVHNEEWYHPKDISLEARLSIPYHIETEPFIVPPILMKSALVEQPILRIIWQRAYELLSSATEVTFIGYSCPITDNAVKILFDEALKTLPRDNIFIVNRIDNKNQQKNIQNAYKQIFGKISNKQFYYSGALEWIREVVNLDISTLPS